MENTNVAVNEVKAVNVESVQEEKTMENTTTAVKTVVSAVKGFEVIRVDSISQRGNKYDYLELKFDGRPERVIINRLKAKGFSFNWKSHRWSTIAFNDKKAEVRDYVKEEMECKRIVQSILDVPFTKEQNDKEQAEANEKNNEWRKNHPEKVAKSESAESSKSTKKSKETAKTSVKKDSKPKSETAKPTNDMDKILMRAFLLSKGITDTKTLSDADKMKLFAEFNEYKKNIGA